jgi:hypothetical protein
VRRLAVAIVLALSASCSVPPAPPRPVPQVLAAGPELRLLRVHVYQQIHPPETPEDDYEYHHTPGHTDHLRNAFQVALARAGYTVVLRRHEACDLVARIAAVWEDRTGAVATLKLTADDRVIEQFSAVVPKDLSKDYGDYYYDEGAARLVDRMSSSPNVGAFAHDVAAKTPKIAAPR